MRSLAITPFVDVGCLLRPVSSDFAVKIGGAVQAIFVC